MGSPANDMPVSGRLLDTGMYTETEIFRRSRGELHDESGRTYTELRNGLKPRYGWIWVQVFIAYVCIVGIGACVVLVQPHLIVWWQSGLVGWPAAIGIGYLIAYISNWFHEAVHSNVHPDQYWNDLLANLFLGIIKVEDVRRYRPIHFQHHKYLGQVEDTERSYFDPLNLRYLLESLTGIKVIRVLRYRAGVSSAANPGMLSLRNYFRLVPAVGMLLHLGVIGASLYLQQYALAVAWAFGVFIFFPFFVAVRQILEHRKPDADPNCDYRHEPHGDFTRVFEEGLFANTFGGAGFNRHLIHHWDPSISCTRFAEVERFFEHSQLKHFYAGRKTTYTRALLTLLRQSAGGKTGGA